jgi:hypothetical protein
MIQSTGLNRVGLLLSSSLRHTEAESKKPGVAVTHAYWMSMGGIVILTNSFVADACELQ